MSGPLHVNTAECFVASYHRRCLSGTLCSFVCSYVQLCAEGKLEGSNTTEFNEDRLAPIVRSVYTALQGDSTATTERSSSKTTV